MSSETTPEPKTADTKTLNDMKVADLKEFAVEHGIEVPSKANKAEIIAAIEAAHATPEDAEEAEAEDAAEEAEAEAADEAADPANPLTAEKKAEIERVAAEEDRKHLELVKAKAKVAQVVPKAERKTPRVASLVLDTSSDPRAAAKADVLARLRDLAPAMFTPEFEQRALTLSQEDLSLALRDVLLSGRLNVSDMQKIAAWVEELLPIAAAIKAVVK